MIFIDFTKTDLLQLQELLSLLLGSTQLLDHLESGVQVETSQHVSQVEQVHPCLALEVVDVEGKSGSFHVFWCEISLTQRDSLLL